MNLLYVSSQGGGLDTNIRVLAPALVKAGHRVSVVYLAPAGSGAVGGVSGLEGYNVVRSSFGNWHYYAFRATFAVTSLPRIVRSFEHAVSLRRVVRAFAGQDRLDLIEIPEVFVTPFLLDRNPYVVRLHSSAWTWQQMYAETTDLAATIEKWLESYSLKRANGISSPSVMLGDFIRQACSLGSRTIELIPYPVDTTLFVAGEVSKDSERVLFVGRLEKRKGADTLMRAIPMVSKRCPHVEFFFAGRLCDDVQPLAASMPANVHFLGVVPHPKLVKWYQSAAIFVAPSRWDNSPNTIYEAMACGTPVVASRVGGIPELVDDGATGLLVPPTDDKCLAEAIIGLLCDRTKRAEMGRKARDRAVARFRLEDIAARTLTFYDRALNSNAHSHCQSMVFY